MGFVTNRQDATIGWHVKFAKAGSGFHASCVKDKEEQELESCYWYCKPCDTKLGKIIPTIEDLRARTKYDEDCYTFGKFNRKNSSWCKMRS